MPCRLPRKNLVRLFVSLLITVPFTVIAEERPELPRIPPTPPAETSKTFQGVDGFTLQLLAAEPLTTDPVAAAYDEHGRLWVVEMNDYPYTDKSTDKPNVERTTDLPLGKVRILTDNNDDGVFDQSEIFARDLSWPTGIALYDGGAFVAGTPDIWYLKDTDGDGTADLRKKIFSGFRKFNVQAVVNNLIWGLDSRIYGAGGTNGGTITFAGSEQPIRLVRGDFRFDPRSPEFEILSGGARFGNSFDDWGNRFICNIRNPAQQILFPAEYLARNPYLPVTSAIHDVTVIGDQVPVYRTSPPEPWRLVNAQRLSSQGDPLIPRSEKNAAGFMTSACGTTVYRGDAYPSEYRGQLFIGEVAGNLIHRELMTREGVTFTSHRIDQQKEFLTSTDNWFRPVNLIHAPDGTLHVLDMYRETIEHPWSIPDDLKVLVDLESGRDRGRIYRLAPPNFTRRPTPRLGEMGVAELVNILSHANSWHRETAQRLLFERQDLTTTPLLQEVIRTGEQSLGRLHALWTLVALKGITEEDLLIALADSEPGIREQAVKIAEPLLRNPGSPRLRDKVLELANDPESEVRFQVSFTLGEFDDPRCAAALEQIARRDASDPEITTAVLSSSAELAPTLLSKLISDSTFVAKEPHTPLLQQLAIVVGVRRNSNEISPLLAPLLQLCRKEEGISSLETIVIGLNDGLHRKGTTLHQLCGSMSPPSEAGLELLSILVERNRKRLAEETLDTTRRLTALKLVGTAPYPEVSNDLFALLSPRTAQELQVAIVQLLAGYADPEIASRLLAGWRGYSPPVQFAVAEACVNNTTRLPPLFDAIESGTVPATQLSPLRRTLLMKHSDEQIRTRAVQLFSDSAAGPRQEILQNYLALLKETGDSTRGKLIFEKQCQVCHKIGQSGHDVGPSLVTIKHRRSDEILTAILDPNREVGPNFVQYAILLNDGRTVTGMIAEETATSVTLLQQENKQEVILRSSIDEISNTGISMMPEGLEKNISPDEMSDLLTFLRSL